jgi:hypothetical protein
VRFDAHCHAVSLAPAVPTPCPFEDRRRGARLSRIYLPRTPLPTNSFPKQEFHLAIDAAEIVLGSPGNLLEELGVKPKEERLAIGHQSSLGGAW